MKTLIMVDIQNDFLPEGSLAVPEGDKIIPLLNRLQSKFDLTVLTQDWHPVNHESFAVRHQKEPGEVIMLHGIEQILWPVHCVQGTNGAEIASELNVEQTMPVFRKGTDPKIDSYSAFFDNGKKKSTGLGKFLKDKGVSEIYITGLALDYCVKYSALDAKEMDFNTFVIEDATRGVNLSEGDVQRAIAEMRAAGIEIIQSTELN